MEKKKPISMAVIKRLPKYHRYLNELLKNDVDRISSKELGEKIGFTASQIRQDLNCFGDFGQQGYGYNVRELASQISTILGLDKEYNAVIIGAGNIGQAIANYTRFGKMSFNVLKKYRTVIFINGCFWHGHENCRYFVIPKPGLNSGQRKS